MKTALALDLPEDHSFVPIIRHIARLLLERHGVAADDVADVEVVLGELASNATRHARSSVGYFHVRLEYLGDRITLLVCDYGQGLDRTALPPVGSVRTDADGAERFGGFGLHLVSTLADNVEFHTSHPTGTTIIAEKRLKATV